MTRARLKLQMELVPKQLHGISLYNVNRSGWVKLRKQTIAEHGAFCAICGATGGRLFGHEVWQYEERKTTGTATLIDIKIVCTDCHDIIHPIR
jgi:predicted HNH restriction endonuclease